MTPVRNPRYYPYMETDMELTKKTTILLSPDLHAHLARTARARRTSLGQLVREACEIQYGHVSGRTVCARSNHCGACRSRSARLGR